MTMIDCADCKLANGKSAACCQEISIRMGVATDMKFWDDLRWMVAHKNVSVARKISDGEWYVIFETECEQLTSHGRCWVYDSRPNICADYSSKTCVINGSGDIYDLEFNSYEDFTQYMKDTVVPEYEKDLNQSQIKIKKSIDRIKNWPLR